MDALIQANIPAGDYLLRAEAIALHVASSLDGAQFYMSCCKFEFPSSSPSYLLSCLTPLNSYHLLLRC
jgi:cellulase